MTPNRIKFVSEIVAGQSPASDDVSPITTGPPFLQGKAEFGGSHPTPRYECSSPPKQALRGDILVSVRAPVGAVNVADQNYGIGRGLAAVRADSIEPRYLRWVVQNAEGLLRSEANGSTFEAITAPTLGNVAFLHEDLATQQRIADYLDRETGEIDTMIAKLDELARALSERAADVPILFALGQNTVREDDLHSPLAGIPDHWDRTRFGFDFTESTERNGDDPPGPLLSISEYRGVELNTRSEGQQASLDVSNYRVVRPNQLAANMMWLNHGGLGVSKLTGYISPDYKAFWISERFNPRYVHHLFRSSRYVEYFHAIGTGVRPNAQRVTKTALDMMPVPLPPMAEQERIADHLDEVTSRIDTMLAKVAELKSLLVERRAALITDVVTGRKEVA